MLSSGDLVIFKASFRDAQKGRSGLVSECLEKAFLLLEDMQELKGLRKCEVFLSLKRDLAKVSLYASTFLTTYTYPLCWNFECLMKIGCASILPFVAEEWVDYALSKSREAEGKLAQSEKA